MGDFAGLVHLDGAPVDDAAAMRLSRSVWSPRPPRIWRPDGCSVFIEGQAAVRVGLAPPQPPNQNAPGRTLLVDAWLENPGDIARDVGGDRQQDHRALVAAACARWGVEAAIQRLHGEVSVALWDQETRRLTLARDALGAIPIYYVSDARFVLFATSLQTMLAMPETPRDLDPVVVAHTMTSALQDQEQTIYRHIRRAPPGGFATFEPGRSRIWRYFTSESLPDVRLASDNAYVESARALLDQAVGCRLPEAGPYVSELSGGFDSAGVTATTARLLTSARLAAYTRLPSGARSDDGLDERYFAGELVARYDNIDWRMVDQDRDSLRDLNPESEAGATLVPRMSSFNATWFEAMMLEVERSGAAVLLTGASGNITLSHAGAQPLTADLRAGRWAKVLSDLKRVAANNRRSFPRTVGSAFFHALAPRTVKRWRVHRQEGDMPWLAFSVVSPDFLSELDYETHARAVGHDVPFELPYDQKEHRLRMLQAQRARDFRGFVRRRRSVQPRDPYTDRRLVEFCLGIPDDQYWRDGQSRWLARRVLADRVPAETLAQHRRGLQSPDWYLTASRQREGMAEAIDRIARSPLASRVIDIPRMRALLDDWPKDAEAARKTRDLHGNALQRAIAMGGFLRWHEGRND